MKRKRAYGRTDHCDLEVRTGWRSAPPRRSGGHYDDRTEDHALSQLTDSAGPGFFTSDAIGRDGFAPALQRARLREVIGSEAPRPSDLADFTHAISPQYDLITICGAEFLALAPPPAIDRRSLPVHRLPARTQKFYRSEMQGIERANRYWEWL